MNICSSFSCDNIFLNKSFLVVSGLSILLEDYVKPINTSCQLYVRHSAKIRCAFTSCPLGYDVS